MFTKQKLFNNNNLAVAEIGKNSDNGKKRSSVNGKHREHMGKQRKEGLIIKIFNSLFDSSYMSPRTRSVSM